MSDFPKIKGEKLIDFLGTLGCNTREKVGQHVSVWSVYTGDFLIVPVYEKPLSEFALKYIIWHLGVTDMAFMKMWEDYRGNRVKNIPPD